MANSKKVEVTGWVGWIGFASLMLLVSGSLHMLQGFVALFKETVFVTPASAVWVLDYNQWGWAHILGGLAVLLAAGSLARGNAYGRVVAVLVALVSMLVSVAFLPVYPLWSAMAIVVDVLVIWAVTVHGSEVKKLG